MPDDIRIKTSVLANPKVMLLIRKLGDHGFVCLLRLWCFTADNKPDGDLSAYPEDMIEAAAGWTGEDDLFFETLCTLGFLDCDGDIKKLHDWKEHQRWVVGAPNRSKNASKKVLLRWCVQNIPKKQQDRFKEWFDTEYQYNKDDNTESILAVYKQYTKVNTPLLSSPLPSPLPKDICPNIELSQILSDVVLLRRKRTITKTTIDSWANTIRLMVERDGLEHDEIKTMLSWYGVHWNDSEFVPVVESAKSLREKWTKLVNA